MSAVSVSGALRKLRTQLDNAAVSYRAVIGAHEIDLNPLLGQTISLHYSGTITCIHCDRKTNKSFSQGYCYPCFQKLAQCDICIVSPEKCHHDAGTCREPEWAAQYCMQPHVVYLANSSGIKVGITRGTQVPTRWIDQGAVQALPILGAQTRQQSGLIEVMFKPHVADKTNWRAMLKGQVSVLDLYVERDRLLQLCAAEIETLQQRFGLQAIQLLPAATAIAIDYPVLQHPEKVVSLDLEKTPRIEGRLLGIKGQYLMLDIGVLNIRKFGAYHVTFSTQ
ncbi:MAG: hypothetical protein JWM78_3202 [Verrucomicrobiaceae bacterium]|nr:hypothetical protein [Verrucomicrobiaceae bacterium]